jgi:arylsulfatase A-like enzyme
VLKSRGYHTAAIHSAFPVSAYFGLDRGYDVFESFDAAMEVAPNGAHGWDVRHLQRRSDQTTDLAIAELKRAREPFFLWVHYWDPHDAVRVPPPEFLPADVPRGEHGEPLPSRQLYAAEVHYMDHELGRLVHALRESGEYERTLFVIVADHGEGLGDHGWENHRILYQEQVRVPLIVRVPSSGPSSAAHADAKPGDGPSDAKTTPEVHALVRTIDIFPTVLDYLRVSDAPRVRGKSLRALIEGRAEPPRSAYADQINGYDKNAGMVQRRPLDDFLYCAIADGWKLVYRPAHPAASELYDLARDPREATDRFASEPERVHALMRDLADFKGWVTSPFPATSADPHARSAQRALAGLGYGGSADSASDAGATWTWTCPLHDTLDQPSYGTCPQCGAPLVPVRRAH